MTAVLIQAFSATAIAASLLLLPVTASRAQIVHDHGAMPPDAQVGTVNFPISCKPESQAAFSHGVAILHSFWFEESLKAFSALGTADPACAMAQWGVAMSSWYELWYPATPDMLKAGAAALAKAQPLAKTEREAAYLAAIGAYFQDPDKQDHRARSLAYERAMEALHARYPDDREAAVFYALSLNATQSPSDKTYANLVKAAAILEPILAEQPNHPGVAHYLIHSYDAPPLAERGLAAAQAYGKIAPAVPHALHMPSHIFTRVGAWPASIASNIASVQAGRDYQARTWGPGVVWDQTMHGLDYLEYAYLQTGQYAAARQVVDEVAAYQKAMPPTLASGYAVAVIPARYAVERRDWTAAAALRTPSMAHPWERFPLAEALITHAHALGAAHLGDLAGVEADIVKLAALREALLAAKEPFWATQAEVQLKSAQAMLAQARGRNDEALGLMRAAADLEGAMEKAPVMPGYVVPARELLGDMLLEMNQPALALAEYDRSLQTEPGRFRSVFGEMRAAQQMGDATGQRRYGAQLLALTDGADSAVPELAAARAAGTH